MLDEFMTRIGYFEGTDPLLLSTLAAEGVETLPVANTWDGHGKPVNQLSKGEVNAVIGYLHKVIPTEHVRTSMFELMLDNMLAACKTYDIPVLLIAPANQRDKAKKILGATRPNLQVVAPNEVEDQIRKHL
jgi:hypothetical protein